MAEATGFEPAKGVNPYTLSKRAPSTARPHFHSFDYNTKWVKRVGNGGMKNALLLGGDKASFNKLRTNYAGKLSKRGIKALVSSGKCSCSISHPSVTILWSCIFSSIFDSR